MENTFEYDVALSFAGEDRLYVEELITELEKLGIRYFYDYLEQDVLWGKDLYQYLQEVYRNKALYCIPFVSNNYLEKSWTKLELKHAQSRAFTSDNEYILPVMLEDVEAPGINPTTGYLDARKTPPCRIAELLAKKIPWWNPTNNPYEFVVNIAEISLEILDLEGKEAKYSKRHTLTPSVDSLSLFKDGICSDGHTGNFFVDSGKIIKQYRERGLEFIESKLDRPLPRGIPFSREFCCYMYDSYTQADEYFIQEQVYPTERLIMNLILPSKRPLKSVDYVYKQGNYDAAHNTLGLTEVTDNVTKVTWEINRPKLKDFYKIEWKW